MKGTLILSDNIEVVINLLEVLAYLNLDAKDFDFSCSSAKRSKEYSIHLNRNVSFCDLRDARVIDALSGKYKLILSLHCQQVFPSKLITNVKCINVHPGYLPDNRGWYPHIFSIMNDKCAGVTIHEMSTKIDNGPIIKRVKISYPVWYTSMELYRDILIAEKELLRDNLISILNGKYETTFPEKTGKLYLKKDFEDIKRLDLDQIGSYREFINRLRGLTHGDFKNAYFIDPETNRRVFVKIDLELEQSKHITAEDE